ncbi:MAG: porin family protein [Cytophagales bacterium]|nr:porin family protein [Cytophagales bacterium]
MKTIHIIAVLLLGTALGQGYANQRQPGTPQADSLDIPAGAAEKHLLKLDSLVDAYSPGKGELVTDSVENILTKAVDQVNRQIDSLQKIVEHPMQYPEEMVRKADSTLHGISGKVQDFQHKIESKTGSLSSYADGLGAQQLFEKCGKQQKLLDDLPALKEQSLKDPRGSMEDPGIDKEVMSRLPEGIDPDISGLVSSGDLNAHLNKQLQTMGIPGSKEWKEAAKNPGYLDELMDRKAGQFAEAQHLSRQAGELDRVKKLSAFKTLPADERELVNRGRKLVIKNAKDHLSGHEAKLLTAQSQLSKLKKKYTYVGSTTDMKHAKKARSLKGEPLKKRLVVGGNFNLHRGNPTSVDLAPSVMYKLDKKTSLGLSGTYRVKLGIEDQFQTTVTQDVYGYSVLGEYRIGHGFFGYGEFEYLSRPDPDPAPTDKVLRTWQEGLLFGIGKQFSFTKGINARLIITYNALYEEDKTPSNSPWNFKFGLNLKKLGLKGIQL